MARIPEALEARETVIAAVQWIRARAGRDLPSDREPSHTAEDLSKAFEALESDDRENEEVAPVRRWTFYGVLRAGFASHELGRRLRVVRNADGEPIGEQVCDWTIRQLQRYEIDPSWIGRQPPQRAAEWTTQRIRMILAGAGIVSCDPENLELEACRGPHPTDTDYITTVRAAADFPRTVAQLAQVYDPRQWDLNPYAPHFDDVHAVTDVNGNTNKARTEPIGTTWSCPSADPCWISERVLGPSGSYLVNTLKIQFVVTSDWILMTYKLGMTVDSSGTLTLERDFGYLAVAPVPGRPGWCRAHLEKNVNFSGTMGTSGGDIGWGDLANLIAPDLIAKWIADMCHAACWIP